MALTSQDLARVANLARLELKSDQTEQLLGSINGFFKLVEQMNAVNTDGVALHVRAVNTEGAEMNIPKTASIQLALRLREDAVTETNQRQANQASAPAVERGLFLVPKVIE